MGGTEIFLFSLNSDHLSENIGLSYVMSCYALVIMLRLSARKSSVFFSEINFYYTFSCSISDTSVVHWLIGVAGA